MHLTWIRIRAMMEAEQGEKRNCKLDHEASRTVVCSQLVSWFLGTVSHGGQLPFEELTKEK